MKKKDLLQGYEDKRIVKVKACKNKIQENDLDDEEDDED